MKYYMRSKIVRWDDAKPVVHPTSMFYGLCEVFKSRADFEKAYPDEEPIELEGNK